MDDLEKAAEDLRYLRQVTERASRVGSPSAIALLWAAVAAVGFPLIDVAPHAAGRFWLVAPPLATVLALWLAIRGRARLGQRERERELRQAMHWTGLLAVAGLALLAARLGAFDSRSTPVVVLLLVSLGFWTAGVHLEAPLRWLAALPALGSLLVGSGRLALPWTVTGAALASGLVLMTFAGSRRHGG